MVETHHLGAGLARQTWDSRLAALFSTPFVVASALVHGHVDPTASSEALLDDPRVRRLAHRVVVRVAPDLDARLRDKRAPARVTVRTRTGTRTHEVPNPVGDVAHHPLGEQDLIALLGGWLHDRWRSAPCTR